MKQGEDEKLAEAVLKAAYEDEGRTKLACKDALRLASEHGVEPISVGRICDQKKIKLCKCQLGCFE